MNDYLSSRLLKSLYSMSDRNEKNAVVIIMRTTAGGANDESCSIKYTIKKGYI